MELVTFCTFVHGFNSQTGTGGLGTGAAVPAGGKTHNTHQTSIFVCHFALFHVRL